MARKRNEKKADWTKCQISLPPDMLAKLKMRAHAVSLERVETVSWQDVVYEVVAEHVAHLELPVEVGAGA